VAINVHDFLEVAIRLHLSVCNLNTAQTILTCTIFVVYKLPQVAASKARDLNNKMSSKNNRGPAAFPSFSAGNGSSGNGGHGGAGGGVVSVFVIEHYIALREDL